MTTAAAIAEQKARLERVNDALYRAIEGTSVRSVQDRVDTWHTQAVLWDNLSSVLEAHPERAGEWAKIGEHLASDAEDIAQLAQTDGVFDDVAYFRQGMPGALVAVSKNVVTGAARAVGFVASEAGKAAGDILSAALGAVPWPVWAAAGVVGVVALVIAVREGGTIVKAVARVP